MTPSPPPSPPPMTIPQSATWIASHLPSRYDERLAGTTNTFTVSYAPDGCTIRVNVDSSSDFNQLRSSDRSKVYEVKGDPRVHQQFDASLGSGTLDFAKIDPSTLRVDTVEEYIASEEVHDDRFSFAFERESDAQQMLAAMTSLAQACHP